MKTTHYFICLVLLLYLNLNHTLYGQENPDIIKVDQVRPQTLTDKIIIQRLQKDWNKRNSKNKNLPVQWYEIGDGFYGSYSRDNQHYMTLYDLDGNYIETLKQSYWNARIPNPLQSSFDLSNYRTQEITSYWETLDADRKGYYIEVTDDQGKISRLWANEKGDFSSTIPKAKKKY